MSAQTTLPLDLLRSCIFWFYKENEQFVQTLQSEFTDHQLPDMIQQVQITVTKIADYINQFTRNTTQQHYGSVPVPIDDLNRQIDAGVGSVFKPILLRYRRHLATQTEMYASRTFHLEMLTTIRHQLGLLDSVVREEWFQRQSQAVLPSLSDYLSLQRIEELLCKDTLAPRQWDEKFRILFSPTLFFSDLNYFRKRCDLRQSSVAVAFLDIDNFKSFNDKHKEAKIDTNLLPKFMQLIEAHVFSKGYAYRQGGDEYLIILPSVSIESAVLFLNELRTKIASVDYPDIPEHTTVSIGLCVDGPNSPFTDRELLERANAAKEKAKGKKPPRQIVEEPAHEGKNRIASYPFPSLSPDSIEIVAP